MPVTPFWLKKSRDSLLLSQHPVFREDISWLNRIIFNNELVKDPDGNVLAQTPYGKLLSTARSEIFTISNTQPTISQFTELKKKCEQMQRDLLDKRSTSDALKKQLIDQERQVLKWLIERIERVLRLKLPQETKIQTHLPKKTI